MASLGELVSILNRISALQELLGEDGFRAVGNARAARALEGTPEDVAGIAGLPDKKAAKAKLQAIEGVGARTADKIIEYFATGRVAEHDELAAKVPAGLLELMGVPGLGPKTIRAFWQTLGVTDMAGLKKSLADGSALSVPRMGEKAAEKLKAAIATVEGGRERLWIGQALPLAERLVAELGKDPSVERIAFAGSLRRGKDTVGDIDILVATTEPVRVSERFRSLPPVAEILAAGDTKSSVRMRVDVDWGRWEGEAKSAASESEGGVVSPPRPGRTIQCDLRVIPRESWGAALLYFSGSKEHNVALRGRALDRGLTLNEYGLFPGADREAEEFVPPQERGVKPVASREEEDLYAALGLVWVPPEVREAAGELEAKETPRLVEVGDIRSELHAHTTASDGALSIEELAARAKERGFHTIAVTDHSQSSSIAGGLRPDRLMLHVEAVRKAQEKFLTRSGKPTIRILAGSEVDILADGTLDYSDKVLAALDVVVASPHAALGQDPEASTQRLLKAIRHPRVKILGHPTGRLINRRAGMSPDVHRLVAAAAERGVAMEINAHWMRLDLRDVHARAAVRAGCLIAIDCDVHAPEDFDNLRFGVMTARRGWCTPERCVNAWDGERLWEWLGV